MTVALGYGKLRMFTHVFAVGKKAISIGTNRIPGDENRFFISPTNNLQNVAKSDVH